MSLVHEEGTRTVGHRRKGQGIHSSHVFIRGSGASILSSQDERFFSHALRNDDTSCGIRVLLIGRELRKNLESRGGKFFTGSSTEG